MRVLCLEVFFILLAGCEVMHPSEYRSPVRSVADATPFKGRDCALTPSFLDEAAGYKDDFHAVLKNKGYVEVPLAEHPSFTLEVTARHLNDENKNWARLNLRRVGIIVFRQSWKIGEVKKEEADESSIDRHGLVERVMLKLPKCEDAWKLSEGSAEEL